MLGLRQYKGLAIDVWQGNFLDYVCDVLAVRVQAFDDLEKSSSPEFFLEYGSIFDFGGILSQEPAGAEKLIMAHPLNSQLFSEATSTSGFYVSLIGSFEHFLSKDLLAEGRHIAILAEDGSAGMFMASIKEFADKRQVAELSSSKVVLKTKKTEALGGLGDSCSDSWDDEEITNRISFLVDTASRYESFQQALFGIFP